jgi:hypothetical protein
MSKTKIFAVACLLSILVVTSCTRNDLLDNRWVFAHGKNLARPAHVEQVLKIARTASLHGLNGMALSAGFDRLDLAGPEYYAGLEKIKAGCRELGIEIIPVIFSAGYGGSVLAHNPNLASGLPVEDALFVAGEGMEARFEADPPVAIVNGGFDRLEGSRVAGFEQQGKLGLHIVPDSADFKEGAHSLRFENFPESDTDGGNSVLLKQRIKVSPRRCYLISCWVKTEGLSPGRRFKIEIMGKERMVGEYIPRWGADNAWTRLTLGFNSWNNESLEISIGAVGAKSGKLWIDGLALEEVGLVNLLRRPGAPVQVRAEKSGTTYEEGRDYARIEDPQLNCRFEHEGPAVRLLPGTRIKPGEKLRVSYYHGYMAVKGKNQITLCMSEPELLDIWREQARLMVKHLGANKFFLDMDEIRGGGTCKACTDSGMDMGEILGRCVGWQYQAIREANPDAEISIWSDMLDPHHNAGTDYHGQNYYYQARGLYTGSWKHVPRDMVMACWWDEIMDKSLAHFSSLGHKTMAASYYDADDLENPKAWLKALQATPGGTGIMYTTWQDKYELLGAFGDLVSAENK